MSLNLNNFAAVVLAAGEGTRLRCEDKPKVMLEAGGRPMVDYVVDTLKEVGFKREQICIVVGFCGERVKNHLGDAVSYAEQEERKGTAHAAYIGMRFLPMLYKQVIVLNGDDSIFYRPITLQNFILKHQTSGAVATLLSVEAEKANNYGRIIRHESGLIQIIEKEYVTEEQKQVKEVSTGTFCLDREWFENAFPSLPSLRKLGEYGLPTAFAVAQNQRLPVQVLKLDKTNEWFGINTPEELAEANQRLKNQLNLGF